MKVQHLAQLLFEIEDGPVSIMSLTLEEISGFLIQIYIYPTKNTHTVPPPVRPIE
jgi:hypothetical protein